MRSLSVSLAAVAALSVVFLAASGASAFCPLCTPVSKTLSEQVAESDAVILVQWVEAKKAEGKSVGSTTYEVLQVVKSPDSEVAKGARITLDRFRTGQKGDLFVLLGSKASTIEWGSPIEVSEASFGYMSQSPSPEQPTQKRLEYFMKFLEFPDETVANDAYGEFASAPYKDIVPLAKSMPRDRLRKWLTTESTPVTRIGLYGMMLGLCGTSEDEELLKSIITKPNEEFRLGIDGIIGGYLVLAGEKGLDLIDETKLSKKTKPPFSETYSALQAIRFVWQYTDGKISKDRLKKSMRLLLERPELADMVAADLARWKDWEVQDRVYELYDKDDYNSAVMKRAFIKYFLTSVKDGPKGEGAAQPAHVKKGREYLDKLRERDPQLVKEAERYLLLQ